MFMLRHSSCLDSAKPRKQTVLAATEHKQEVLCIYNHNFRQKAWWSGAYFEPWWESWWKSWPTTIWKGEFQTTYRMNSFTVTFLLDFCKDYGENSHQDFLMLQKGKFWIMLMPAGPCWARWWSSRGCTGRCRPNAESCRRRCPGPSGCRGPEMTKFYYWYWINQRLIDM